MRTSRPIHKLQPRKGNKMIDDDGITTKGVPMVHKASKVVFTPVADIALIICETVPDMPFVEACRVAVALQTEGYCKAPF